MQYNLIPMNQPANDSKSVYQRSLKPRPRIEFSSEYFFRPIAHLVVQLLLPLKVQPTWLVVFHTCLGVFCGFLIARGELLLPAILIQIKTVLDNADGQLARASGMISEIGRYLDTEGDTVVNAALFAGLGAITGAWLMAILAFFTFTLLLSFDFNWEYLYRLERNEPFRASPDTSQENQSILKFLERVYAGFFKPQDLAIRSFSESRFEAVYRQYPRTDLRSIARIEYHEADSLLVLANLELSTQLAVLGLCLVLGVPKLFLWFVLLCGLTVVVLQVRREARARAVLQGKHPSIFF